MKVILFGFNETPDHLKDLVEAVADEPPVVVRPEGYQPDGSFVYDSLPEHLRETRDRLWREEAERRRNAKRPQWTGMPPPMCDLCGRHITDTFVDGKTTMGPWGIMCDDCAGTYSLGLGLGLGQKYKREGDVYYKVDG